MNDPKTILVTGCAGFIGSNFVQHFKKNFSKTKIIGIDDFSTGRKDALDPSITFYHGSILDEKLVKKIFSTHKPEYVFHFAALAKVSFSVQQPRHTTEVNILGIVTLLEAAKNYGAKRFIFSSSSSVYGGAKKLPTKESESSPDPKSPYALQKYTGESFCRIFSQLFEMESVCLRYFNVFGPGQYGDSAYSAVISAWLEALYFPGEKPAFVEGDGKQTRDFCYVNNVISANILAMQSKHVLKGEVFNIAYGGQITLNEVKKLIEKNLKIKLNLEKHPQRLGDIKHSCADISKAKKILGYNPKIDFEEGLEKTIEWFKSRKK